MMFDIAIEGVGVVGAFGTGIDALSRAAQEGKSPLSTVSVPTAGGIVDLPVYLADTTSLERFIPKRNLRRIDHFSKMALLGSLLALEDAGKTEIERSRLGLVVATGYGATRTTFSFLDSIFEGGDALASPTHFSSSVHNAAAAHTSIQLGITGPSLTVSQFEMSVPSALLTACLWLEEKRADAVLFGGVDETGELLHHCWHRFFHGADRAEIEPFDFDHQTAVAGEGAAFFVLRRNEEGGAPYGRITGVVQGNLSGGAAPCDERDVLFLGVDGHRECSVPYRSLGDDVLKRGYAPLYGSLPVGQAFDLAMAAISCKIDGLYPGTSKLAAVEPLSDRSICCLKYGSQGDYGLIRIEK